ncbi:MAG TPA: pirin family protein [Bacteroidia bacterium]|nr:pirin family protein [Bacteroidia bacterium]HNT79541.1 pirin family protein [Bacteroidia bacterium]
MKLKYFDAEQRGKADFGWLKARYSFSFAGYQDREKMNFGALRVLNDDCIETGRGFDFHPHNNMEIITIPLQGDLQHKDSMGHSEILKEGQIQVMSAGSGLYHSEFNANHSKELRLLQLWIFPKHENIEPRYAQANISDLMKANEISTLVKPFEAENNLWMNQMAWIRMINTNQDTLTTYVLEQKNSGVYCFVIEGECEIESKQLNRRDAIGIWDADNFTINAQKNSRILFVEVPMN